MKRLAIAALFTALVLCACKSNLAPGGAYAPTNSVIVNGQSVTVAPDKAFYAVDAAYDLAYSVVDAAFHFEADNGALFAQISPGIRRTMNQVRARARDVDRRYALARRTYMANPTPAGLSTLQSILSEANAVSKAAQAALPTQTN